MFKRILSILVAVTVLGGLSLLVVRNIQKGINEKRPNWNARSNWPPWTGA